VKEVPAKHTNGESGILHSCDSNDSLAPASIRYLIKEELRALALQKLQP
jgi:hypothetical protein